MYAAYVIYSKIYHRYYKGHTGDIEKRLADHNRGKVQSTKAFRPWKVVYTECFESEKAAIQREKYFKTAAGRRFLKKKIHLDNI